MSVFKTKFVGTITHLPTGGFAASGMVTIPLRDISRTTTKHVHKVITASSDVDTPLGFADMVNVKLLMIQKLEGSIIFKITTADGTAQIVPVGKLLVWENESKPITVITYTGTGEFEVFMAEW